MVAPTAPTAFAFLLRGRECAAATLPPLQLSPLPDSLPPARADATKFVTMILSYWGASRVGCITGVTPPWARTRRTGEPPLLSKPWPTSAMSPRRRADADADAPAGTSCRGCDETAQANVRADSADTDRDTDRLADDHADADDHRC